MSFDEPSPSESSQSPSMPPMSSPNPSPPESPSPAADIPIDPMAAVVLRVSDDSVDEDGFVSVWSVASASMGGDTMLARALAAKMLGFLCKQRCDFVFTSSTDAKYLDEWFERDPGLLYDWAATSEKVDVLAQHAQVPAQALLRLLQEKRFDATKAYSPRRVDRVEWFSDLWCIG